MDKIKPLIPIAIGAVAAAVGVFLVAFVWNYANETEHAKATVQTHSKPRPLFALDVPDAEGHNLSATDNPYQRRGANLAALTASAADEFEIPLAILDESVHGDLSRLSEGRDLWTLAPLDPDVIDRINVPRTARDRRLRALVEEALDEDLPPLDAQLSRRPEVGIHVRAAHLALSHADMMALLEDAGLAPKPKTGWFLAFVATTQGTDRVVAVLQQALSMGKNRPRRAFEAPSETFELVADQRFATRALLDRSPREDVVADAASFVRSAHHAAAALGLIKQYETADGSSLMDPSRRTWSLR